MMPKSKGILHTPGPWAVHPLRAIVMPLEHIFRPIGAAEDIERDRNHYAQEICQLQWPDRHRPELEVSANARLIALCPEMFEYIESSASNGCATAAALIRKATGES